MNLFVFDVAAKQHHRMLLKIIEEASLLKEAFPERRHIHMPARIQKFFRRSMSDETKVGNMPCCASKHLSGDI